MASSLAQLLAQGGLDPAAYGGLQNVELGNALLQQGLDASPTTGWGALGRLASTLAGSHLSSTGQTSLRDAIASGRKSASSDLMAALTPQSKPSTVVPSVTPTPPAKTTDSGGSYGKAISGIESGGKYDLLGPVTKTGDRAYGKYQVMGANIPEWTQAALGKSMTPQEFVANPDAQEAVFNQRFGQYVDKYGPEGAAKAWFAGEKGMKNPNAKDILGTTVQGYADKFRTALGMPPAVQAIDAAASGQPPAEAAQPRGAAAFTEAPTAAMPTAGATTGQPSIDVQRLMAVLQNPYADDVTKQIAGKLIMQQMSPDLTDTIREYNFAKQENPTLTFEKFLQVKKQAGNEFGLNPIYGTRVNPQTGKEETVLLQTGKTGEAIQTKIPEGIKISGNIEKIDSGTYWTLMDKRTGQVIGTQPKDVQGAAAAEKRGTEQGTAQAALPGAATDAEQAVKKINELIDHPGLDSIVGPIDQLRGSMTLGEKGRDALARYNQLKGTAFLQGYQLLRGGGAITEIEGKKAEDAIARLDRSQSEAEFKQALRDFRDAVQVGLQKLQAKAGGGTPTAAAPTAQPTPGAPDRAAIEAEARKRGLIK